MPITKDVNNIITYTVKRDLWNSDVTGVFAEGDFAVSGDEDPTKQIHIDPTPIPTATAVTIKGNAATASNITVTLPATSGTLLLTSGGGTTTIGTMDSQTKSADGAVIVGSTLYMQTADATSPGLVSTGTQSFAGNKTFTGSVTASNISGTNTGNVSLTAVGSTPSGNAASLSGQALTLQPADGTNPGVITSGTQTIGGAKTFSSTVTASNLSGTNTGDQTITLTGNVTGSGTGSFAATIANNAVTYAKMQQASAYTFLGNSTAGTANIAEQVFKDVGEQTYSSTITWTGTTAPSGSTTHTYRWSQMGKRVFLVINLKYSVAGTALTSVQMVLPADVPVPLPPTGFTAGANVITYYGAGGISTSTSAVVATNARIGSGFAADGTTNVINIVTSSVAATAVWADITYYTA